jgi:hypothetical protein
MQASTPTPSGVSDSNPESTNQSASIDGPVSNKDILAASPSSFRSPSVAIVRHRSVSDTSSRLPISISEQAPGGGLGRSNTTTARMTRKRTAEEVDLLDEHAEDQETDDGVGSHGGDSAGGPLSNHICLCQPAPKIPRPRNGNYQLPFCLTVY